MPPRRSSGRRTGESPQDGRARKYGQSNAAGNRPTKPKNTRPTNIKRDKPGTGKKYGGKRK